MFYKYIGAYNYAFFFFSLLCRDSVLRIWSDLKENHQQQAMTGKCSLEWALFGTMIANKKDAAI